MTYCIIQYNNYNEIYSARVQYLNYGCKPHFIVTYNIKLLLT